MTKEKSLMWYSVQRELFKVVGFGWESEKKIYRRMPKPTIEPLPEAVDVQADWPAGGQIKFQTNSPVVSLRFKGKRSPRAFGNSSTVQCGVDCYVGSNTNQLFVNSSRFPETASAYESVLFHMDKATLRNVTLYLPLFGQVKEVMVGVDKQSKVLAPPPYEDKRRIVIYGTSIVHGSYASRPGTMYTNILSRRFNREIVNLGFGGAARGEAQVARVIATIPDPACFILDYEANCEDLGRMQQTLPVFISILRQARPDLPILVMSKPRLAAEIFHTKALRLRVTIRDYQKALVAKLRKQGDKLLFFHDGQSLLGKDFHDCTVEGRHPTDLGFRRMADDLEPVIKKALKFIPRR